MRVTNLKKLLSLAGKKETQAIQSQVYLQYFLHNKSQCFKIYQSYIQISCLKISLVKQVDEIRVGYNVAFKIVCISG